MHQKVTTASRDAQAFYDQGLTILHHYVFIEAARSFRQALRSDPDCAMCWMGLARAEQGLERPEATAAAIAKAKAFAPKASPKEQTFIALRAATDRGAGRTAHRRGGEARGVQEGARQSARHVPEDAELWILRGNAEEAGPWGRGQFGRSASIAFYETALARSPGHLGAHHYLVHSFENIGPQPRRPSTARSTRARAPVSLTRSTCTGTSCPGSDAGRKRSRSSRRPTRSRGLRQAENLRPGDDWHHLHNLQLMGYTYLRLQRIEDAERTFRRAFDTPSRLPYRGTPQASLAEFYLLRGQPKEALEGGAGPAGRTRTPATRTVAIVVEGEALLAMGKTDSAKEARAARRGASTTRGWHSGARPAISNGS